MGGSIEDPLDNATIACIIIHVTVYNTTKLRGISLTVGYSCREGLSCELEYDC